MMVLTGHVFLWTPESCFGEFHFTDKIGDLVWYDGENGSGIFKTRGTSSSCEYDGIQTQTLRGDEVHT